MDEKQSPDIREMRQKSALASAERVVSMMNKAKPFKEVLEETINTLNRYDDGQNAGQTLKTYRKLLESVNLN